MLEGRCQGRGGGRKEMEGVVNHGRQEERLSAVKRESINFES